MRDVLFILRFLNIYKRGVCGMVLVNRRQNNMAYCGRGSPLLALTAEEEDILIDLKTLTSLTDSTKHGNVSLQASVVIPEGGRRRPLSSITEYRIPKVGGIDPNPTHDNYSKRFGKGRSRIPSKTRDKPLNLGLNREFEMYNQTAYSDQTLPFVSGYRLPYTPNITEESGNNAQLARPKIKMPDLPPFEFLTTTSEHDNSSQHENLHNACYHDQFSDIDEKFAALPRNKGNYDRNNLPESGIISGFDNSSQSVPAWIKHCSEQFSDSDEVLSFKSSHSNIDQSMPDAFNSSTETKCQNNVTENTCASPKIKETDHMAIDPSVPTCSNIEESCSFASVSPKTQSQENSSILNTSMNKLDISAKDSEIRSEKSNSLLDSVKTQSKHNLPLDSFKNGNSLLDPSTVCDWRDYLGNAENDKPNPPLSDNQSSGNAKNYGQNDAELSPLPIESPDNANGDPSCSFSSQFNMQSTALKEEKCIPINEQKYSDFITKSRKKPKPTLKTYNHAQESPMKNMQNLSPSSLTQSVQRQPTLGWGDTSYRNSSVISSVSMHGNAEHFSGISSGLDAFMKPIVRPDPVFSMDVDFPALQEITKAKKTRPPSPNTSWANWEYDKEKSSPECLENDTHKVPVQSDYDRNSIMIENMPPDSETILREFLEEFVNIHSISVFTTNTGNVAYVRLNDNDSCEWLIDCFDGAIPGKEWNKPLKITMLTSALELKDK